MIRKPFVVMPYDTQLLRYPLWLLRSLLLWFVFLPATAAQHTERTGNIYGIIELGLVAMIIINLLQPYVNSALYLFYPVILMVYMIHALIIEALAKRLRLSH